MSLTDETKKITNQTWTLLYKARDQLCTDFEKSIYSDEDVLNNPEVLEKIESINTSLVIDTYNALIEMVCGEETDFESLSELLTRIGRIHVEKDISQPELLISRKHILKVIKNGLGATYNPSTQKAWSDFTGFVMAGLMTSYKLRAGKTMKYSEDAIYPDWEIWEMCKESWKMLEDDELFDSLCKILWKKLSSSSENMLVYFPDMGQIPQLKFVTQILNMSENEDALVDSLSDLGRMHVQLGVTKKDFYVFRDCFYESLTECMGLKMHITWAEMPECHLRHDNKIVDENLQNGDVDSGTTIESAWIRAFNHITYIMVEALEEQWLLELPPDPIEMSLNIQINHLDHIEPVNLSFYGDISFVASDNNANPTMTAFHDSNNIPYDYRNLKQIATMEDFPEWRVDISNTVKSDSIEMYDSSQKHTLVKNNKSNTWYQRGHIKGLFSQYFDLHHFPVDRHELTATFELNCSALTAKFNSNDVKVKVTGDSSSKSAFGGTEYDVLQPYCEVMKSGNQHVCVLRIPIQRRWKHMLYHVFIPLSLIESVGFITYNMDIQPIFHRMSVLVALVLALFTFKWTVDKQMPPVPYMTNLDYHFFLSFFFLFINVCLNGWLTAIAHSFEASLNTLDSATANQYLEAGENANTIMFFCVLVVFIVVKSIIVHQSYSYYTHDNEFENKMKSKRGKRGRKKGAINAVGNKTEMSHTEASVNESVTNTVAEFSKTNVALDE